MYAAATAKPQSIKLEHLGSAPIFWAESCRHLQAGSRDPCAGGSERQMLSGFDWSREYLPPPFRWTPTSRLLSSPRRNVRIRGGIQPFFLRRSHHGNNIGHLRAPAYAGAFAGASRARLGRHGTGSAASSGHRQAMCRGTDCRISRRSLRTSGRRQAATLAYVAAGYRGLSRPDDRDRVALSNKTEGAQRHRAQGRKDDRYRKAGRPTLALQLRRSGARSAPSRFAAVDRRGGSRGKSYVRMGDFLC